MASAFNRKVTDQSLDSVGAVPDLLSYVGCPNSSGAAGSDPGALEANTATFGSIPTLANYLISGYWSPRHWASHTVSVNITGLTAAEQSLAIDALADWSSVCNITFTFTSGSANITYNHNGHGVASTSEGASGGLITSATIDISSDWWPNDNVYSYMFQTYLHETGHALGLGHQGPYNGSATYGVDNIFTNDTWQWSVMSYFPQYNYGGASYDFVITPEMADIYAVQSIYGTTSTRSGDTIYGFHSNAGFIYDFAQYSGTPAFTIYDSGGNNTLDASGYSQNQVLDLNPGHWCSIGGYVNNIGIYLTTNIQNAIGGTGDDLIIPNGSLVGNLTGGGGNNTFQGTQFGLDAYTITDMHVGDKINFTDASPASFSFTRNGTTLNYGSGDFITLSNNPFGQFVETTDTKYGGIDLTLTGGLGARDDFNADGLSDILLQHINGTPQIWLMNGSSITNSSLLVNPGSTWHAAATGDVNLDGKADLIWQNTDGRPAIWEMNGTSIVGGGLLVNPGPSWHVIAASDFNGDGTADILWQNIDGAAAIWEMNGTAIVGGGVISTPAPTWHVIGAGDFNNDGHADVLWQSNDGTPLIWEMNGTTLIGGGTLVNPGPSWHAIGTGDFNGDGHDDILWQNNDGAPAIWELNGTNIIGGGVLINPGPSWHAIGTSDFNGDGKADIIWQNNDGTPAVWEMNGTAIIGGGLLPNPGAAWQVKNDGPIPADQMGAPSAAGSPLAAGGALHFTASDLIAGGLMPASADPMTPTASSSFLPFAAPQMLRT